MNANDRPNERDQDFIRRLTRLQVPANTPEIQLRLADDLDNVWEAVHQRNGRLDEPIPFWAFAWAGGQAVARYLLDHPEIVAGKRVLDIATGSGICAIAAVLAGAASVCAADIDPLCGAAVALNAAANAIDVDYIDTDLLAGPPPEVDLIIAGDIGYEQVLALRMLAWLERAHRRGIEVLIGDPERNYFPRDSMLLIATSLVETTRMLESTDRKQVGLYVFAEPSITTSQ